MQSEPETACGLLTNQQLALHIKSTYAGQTSQQVQNSQKLLLRLPKQYLNNIFSLICNQYKNEQQFQVSAVVIVVKIIQKIQDMHNTDLTTFVKNIYGLLTIGEISFRVKDNIGKILHLLIQKLDMKYRQQLFSRALETQKDINKIQELYGIFVIYDQLFKILSVQNDLVAYFIRLLPQMKNSSQKLCSLLSNSYLIKQSQVIIPVINKLLQLINGIILRLWHQEQTTKYQFVQIRLNQNLNFIINQYLNICRENQSLIPAKYSLIYRSKSICLQIIENLYQDSQLPKEWFQLIYNSFLYQASNYLKQYHLYSAEKTIIICRILDILSFQVKRSLYYHQFARLQKQSLFSLFNFSISSIEELEQMKQAPQKFSQIAQDYSQVRKGRDIIKIKAANFLRTYAQIVDGFLKSLVQISSTIVFGCMAQTVLEKDNSQNFRKHYYQFDFIHLDASTQLQTILLIFTSISILIKQRKDLLQLVSGVQFGLKDFFFKIQNPLVMLRLIHYTGYFPDIKYLYFVLNLIMANDIYKIEGFKCFQRVIESSQKEDFYQFFQYNFLQIFEHLHLDNSLAQVLILKNYQNLLQKNKSLLFQIYDLLQRAFQTYYRENFHKAILAINLLNDLLRRANEVDLLELMKKIENIVNICIENNIFQYQQNIIEIYITLVAKAKQNQIPGNILKFAENNLHKIDHFGSNSNIFIFYNQLFYKFGMNQQFHPYYTSLMLLLFKLADKRNLQMVPHLCYLISEIVILDRHFRLNSGQLMKVLHYSQMFSSLQRTAFLIVFLSFVLVKSFQLVKLLKQSNIYCSTLKFIIQQQYSDKFTRKIFVLAMCKLLQVESQYQIPIVNACIENLYKQLKQNAIKIKNTKIINIKTREYEDFPQQQMTYAGSQFIINNRFFEDFFRKMKHPIIRNSEFEIFKQRIWQNQNIKIELDQEHKEKLRQIIDTDLVGGKTRKIYKVKHHMNNNIGDYNIFQSCTDL